MIVIKHRGQNITKYDGSHTEFYGKYLTEFAGVMMVCDNLNSAKLVADKEIERKERMN